MSNVVSSKHGHQFLSVDDLHVAFETFNKVSADLSRSYEVLESKVIELSGELASVSEQRMIELSEKEKLADQLESLLQILPAAVVVIDKLGRIIRSNLAPINYFCHY